MTCLFLDDIRHPKDVLLYTTSPENSVYDSDGWRVVRDFHQFVDDITKNGLPDLISFDHDLGADESGETKLSGYDCAKWLVDYVMDHQVPLPRIWILRFEWCQPFRSDDASYYGSNDAILV